MKGLQLSGTCFLRPVHSLCECASLFILSLFLVLSAVSSGAVNVLEGQVHSPGSSIPLGRTPRSGTAGWAADICALHYQLVRNTNSPKMSAPPPVPHPSMERRPGDHGGVTGRVSSGRASQHEGGILEVLFGEQDPHLKSQRQGDLVWLTSDPIPLGPS